MKRKIIVCNAFSVGMLGGLGYAEVHFERIFEDEASSWLKDPVCYIESAVGHEDTAKLFSSLLDVEIIKNRIDVKLDRTADLLVGQITGGRLPEGTTILPPGVSVIWYRIWLE